MKEREDPFKVNWKIPLYLGAFAKLQKKAKISFVMSVYPSASLHKKKLDPHSKDYHEN
jgi:hypothetical protein